jgi:hypothetical protein
MAHNLGLDELAIQEGIRKPWETLLMMTKTPYGLYAFTHKDLEHFAALVAAHERESVAASSKRDLTCVCGAVWDGEQMVHAPRKREWVGLTDEEVMVAAYQAGFDIHEDYDNEDDPEKLYWWSADGEASNDSLLKLRDFIEAKLKEKNHG